MGRCQERPKPTFLLILFLVYCQTTKFHGVRLNLRRSKKKQKETLNTFRIIDHCVKIRKNLVYVFGLKSLMKRSNWLMSDTKWNMFPHKTSSWLNLRTLFTAEIFSIFILLHFKWVEPILYTKYQSYFSTQSTLFNRKLMFLRKYLLWNLSQK